MRAPLLMDALDSTTQSGREESPAPALPLVLHKFDAKCETPVKRVYAMAASSSLLRALTPTDERKQGVDESLGVQIGRAVLPRERRHPQEGAEYRRRSHRRVDVGAHRALHLAALKKRRDKGVQAVHKILAAFQLGKKATCPCSSPMTKRVSATLLASAST